MTDIWTYHPQPDENGRRVRLHQPAYEANLDCLADPSADLTFVPGSARGDTLNGVPFSSSGRTEPDLASSPAGNEALVAEPAFALPAGKRAAAGAVVRELDGRIWLVAPSNAFGGYQATFPKGRVEPGMSLQATAIREVWEESGLHVALVAYIGDFARTQTFTRFYLARRVGGHPGEMGWESQAVHLVSPARARQLLNRETDHAVLDALDRLD
jgi:8-oxo-dGTP pyrophosphatase MutT (NUDIX family)